MTEVKRENAVKIEGRQYIVVSPDLGNDWAVGTILTLSEDDGTNLPWFTDKLGNGGYVYMHEVMLLAETAEKAGEPVKPKLPEHKYTVGQKLTVNGNTDIWNCYSTGTEVEVKSLYGHWGKNRIPRYNVISKYDGTQLVHEGQLEPVAPHITEEQYATLEVGDTIVIRDDLEIGKYGEDSVVKEMLLQKGKQLKVKAVVGNTSGVRVEETIYNWTQQMIAEVIKKEKAVEKSEHKYAVGDRVKIIETDNFERVGTTRTGDIAIIKELEDYFGRTHTENGTPYYKVRTNSGCTQVVTEYQLSKLDKNPEFLIEEGQFYLADQTGNYSHNWIIKAGEITDDSVEMGFALSTDNASYTTWGELPFSDVTKWIPATDEQKIKLLTAMAEHGDATDSDLDLLSQLMPLDNPKLEVGAVYYRKGGAIIRAEHNDTAGGSLTGNFLEGKTFLEKNGSRAYIDHGYRKALPHEVVKLEDAEKEHGCEYKKPLINSKGTVIEVGQYYSGKDWETVSKVLEVSENGYSELRLEDGEFTEYTFNELELPMPYTAKLVPATLEAIVEFKTAEIRSEIQVGQTYRVEMPDSDNSVFELTITGKDEKNFNVTYEGISGKNVSDNISQDSAIWKDAELVE